MPSVRADIIDAYIFRRAGSEPSRAREDADTASQPGARDAHSSDTPAIELLQLRRARAPLTHTWQPVMGHVEPGETAVRCLWRELAEETGLAPADVLGAWALEQVHPFYLPELDAVMLSPRFAVEVAGDWTPRLNHEHDASRWVPAAEAESRFMWPGQQAAIEELIGLLSSDASERREHTRISSGA